MYSEKIIVQRWVLKNNARSHRLFDNWKSWHRVAANLDSIFEFMTGNNSTIGHRLQSRLVTTQNDIKFRKTRWVGICFFNNFWKHHEILSVLVKWQISWIYFLSKRSWHTSKFDFLHPLQWGPKITFDFGSCSFCFVLYFVQFTAHT